MKHTADITNNAGIRRTRLG